MIVPRSVSAVLLFFMLTIGLSTAAESTLELLSKPAMRLFGIFSMRDGWGEDLGDTWSDEDVATAADLEMMYPTVSTGTSAKIRAARKGPIMIKYENYGGTGAKEAVQTELNNHADVAYYLVGRLSSTISSSDTNLTITQVKGPGILKWTDGNRGGLKPSTSKGNSSVIDKHGKYSSYITWLRIGSEYLKLEAVQPGKAANTVEVTVARGLWNSPASKHKAYASVTSPVYHAKGCYPGGENGMLRYALDPSKQFTAQYLAAAFETTYDGMWMDCFGSSPFRAGSARGDNVHNDLWDMEGDRPFLLSGYVAAQVSLSERVRTLIKAKGATHLYGNNVDSWTDAPELLKPGEILDGGALEAFIGNCDGGCGYQGNFNLLTDHWMRNVIKIQNQTQQNRPIMPMTGSCGCESVCLVHAPKRQQIEDFSYASFLLAAGTRAALFGITPYKVRHPSRGQGGGFKVHLDQRYYLPIGTPMQTAEVGEIETYRVAPCTYARRFETALVLVNPSTNCTDQKVALNNTWYDPSGHGAPLREVAMPPAHGLILLTKPLSGATPVTYV